MLFVVLIYRNKITRVCPWFYFYWRLFYVECSISSLLINLYLFDIFGILEIPGTEEKWAVTLIWVFSSAILSLFIYLYVLMAKYLH